MYNGILKHVNEWVSYGERSQEKLKELALQKLKESPNDDDLFLDREFQKQSEKRFTAVLDKNINEILQS